ncbi:GNAT family N-acetyltransferase [Patescibacteria group bacterium]|nr:GNAT family N-acetyltransferase [Patescibacteria group bacterium]
MKLVTPNLKYEKSWKEGLVEFDDTELWDGFWNVLEKPTNLKDYIKKTKDYSKGKNLPEHWVTSNTYWLVDKEKFIGHVNVRHKLSEQLKKAGGHIGYAIRPSMRKQGYGLKILQLALLEAKKIGLNKVLITCEDSNQISQKIIEKNNGQLENIFKVNGKMIRHYWIKLS